MLGKLIGKKSIDEVFVSPIQGEIIKIEDSADEVFAAKMLGDGIAIIPTEGKVVSPVEGKITQIFPTKHAIGIESTNGLEILIHIGLDTVFMQGEGFSAHIEVNDVVKPGDLLMTFDLELVKEKAASIITPMVVVNSDKVKKLDKFYNESAISGKTNVLIAKIK